MKKQLLLLFILTVTLGYSQELLVVDLTVTDQVTVTATTAAATNTVSGSDTTGFYFENFFTTDEGLAGTLVSGDLTSFLNTSDGTPGIFRGGGGTDPGLNIWTYTDDATSDFVAGTQAFSGSATWDVSPEDYASFLTANATGDLYFPADTADDIAGGATLIGTYSVNFPLSVTENQIAKFEFYPNPVNDVLNVSSQKTIEQVDIFNILGQIVSTQKLNALNGTVNTAALEVGTYFVRAISQDGTTGTFKIVKR